MKKLLLVTVIFAMVASVLSLGACGLFGGGDSIEISKSESLRKMEELGKTEGYEIDLSFRDSEGTSGNFTVGCKDDSVWGYNNEGEGFALKHSERIFLAYTYENGSFSFDSSITEAEVENYKQKYTSIYEIWLYYGNEFNGLLKKGANAAVAGRNCYTYTFKMGDLGVIGNLVGKYISDVDFEYRICVDIELGITMKLEIAAQAEGESNSISCEITAFRTGSAVNVPLLPDLVE